MKKLNLPGILILLVMVILPVGASRPGIEPIGFNRIDLHTEVSVDYFFGEPYIDEFQFLVTGFTGPLQLTYESEEAGAQMMDSDLQVRYSLVKEGQEVEYWSQWRPLNSLSSQIVPEGVIQLDHVYVLYIQFKVPQDINVLQNIYHGQLKLYFND